MFKQIVTFGVACAVLTGAAAEAAGAPMFDNRTRQVAGSAVTSDYSGDTLYTESDENLLVARVDSGRPERKTVRKPVGKTIKQTSGISAVKPVGTRMSLDELRRHRPQGKPAARIVTEEARPAALPVRQAENPAPVVADVVPVAADMDASIKLLARRQNNHRRIANLSVYLIEHTISIIQKLIITLFADSRNRRNPVITHRILHKCSVRSKAAKPGNILFIRCFFNGLLAS